MATDVITRPVPMPAFDYIPKPYTGPSREAVLALRRPPVGLVGRRLTAMAARGVLGRVIGRGGFGHV